MQTFLNKQYNWSLYINERYQFVTSWWAEIEIYKKKKMSQIFNCLGTTPSETKFLKITPSNWIFFFFGFYFCCLLFYDLFGHCILENSHILVLVWSNLGPNKTNILWHIPKTSHILLSVGLENCAKYLEMSKEFEKDFCLFWVVCCDISIWKSLVLKTQFHCSFFGIVVWHAQWSIFLGFRIILPWK